MKYLILLLLMLHCIHQTHSQPTIRFPYVTIYQHSDYRGEFENLRDSRPRLSTTKVKDNKASSIWIEGDYAVTIYENERYGGQSSTFVKSDPDFGNDNIRHDRASSVEIIPGGCDGRPGVYLYEKPNHSGRCSRFAEDTRSLRRLFIQPATASSIRFVGDWEATLFSEENFGGAREVVTQQDQNFFDNTIRSGTRSIRVRPASVTVPASALEEVPVVRAQLRITTADVEDAGTDDDILVSLRENNYTWLNYGRILDHSEQSGTQLYDGDDFERGNTFTYDLNLDGISQVRDIKWIVLSKAGDEGWCVRKVELLINNQQPAVSYTFNTPRWLDNRTSDYRSVIINFTTLRNSPLWNSTNLRSPSLTLTISPQELVSRIHSKFGHAMHGTKAYWAKPIAGPVTMKTINESTIEVKVFLHGSASVIPDPDVWIRFNLVAVCAGNDLKIEAQNISSSVSMQLIVKWFLFFLEDDIKAAIDNIIGPYAQQLNETISVPRARCASVRAFNDESITITFEPVN